MNFFLEKYVLIVSLKIVVPCFTLKGVTNTFLQSHSYSSKENWTLLIIYRSFTYKQKEKHWES